MKSLWILLPILVSFLVYNLIGRDPPFGLRSQPWNPPPYAHNTTDKFHNILATSKKYFEGMTSDIKLEKLFQYLFKEERTNNTL
jgi:hypothetical protein